MSKWFLLLLLIAAFTGTYWAVMSGSVAEKMIAFDVRDAARENEPPAILDALKQAEERLDTQKQWVEYFKFMNRSPDWTRVEETRQELHNVQDAAQEIIERSGPDIGAEGTESLRRYLRTLRPLHAGVFREGQSTVWAVLFWIAMVGVVITGLLAFVRRMSD
jgi:hypothetical protein